jgi:hypothetical protein
MGDDEEQIELKLAFKRCFSLNAFSRQDPKPLIHYKKSIWALLRSLLYLAIAIRARGSA